MKIKSDIERGWEFASHIIGANLGADMGANYISTIESEIEKFTQDMLTLQSRKGSLTDPLSGFVAEHWHAGTFNVNAVAAGSSHRANVVGSTDYASVDIGTNFGVDYSSKYYTTAEGSVTAQAQYSSELGAPKYEGQMKLIPTEQLDEGMKIAHRRGLSNQDTRPHVSESYLETERTLTDRISDGKVESESLTKAESLKQAEDIKEGEFSPDEYGVTLDNAIKAEYIIKNAMKAGVSTAAITVAIQLAPDIYKAIDDLIKNGELNVEQLKSMGKKAITSGAEGFLRGSISYSLVVACQSGKFGATMVSVSPLMVASTVAILIETIKNGIMVSLGKMQPREMGSAFVDSVVTTTGFVGGMHIGGVIGQALGFELPVFGYLLGSLIGCAFCVTYNVAKRKLISFCADTGFTCFGLVEQDYTLPEEYLNQMGISTIKVKRNNIATKQIKTIGIKRKNINGKNYETIDIKELRRGVIGVNKIGYVFD